MNPVPDAQGLKLNVSQADNALDLDLARSVAAYFRIKDIDAQKIIERLRNVVSRWPTLANGLKISSREQEQLASAFRLARH